MQDDLEDREASAREYLRKLFAEKPKAEDTLERFVKFLYEADDMVEIVLKCHLMIEEVLTRIVSKSVAHPDFIDKAGLSFWQKLNIARSMSFTESENGIWPLVAGFNKLRNDYGHSLEPPKAPEHVKALRNQFFAEGLDQPEDKDSTDEDILKNITISVLGFLITFEEEVEQFRRMMGILNHFAKRSSAEGKQ